MKTEQGEPHLHLPKIKRESFREFILMLVGVSLTAIGTYFFKFPNKISTGGVTGLAVILGELFPVISTSTYNLIISLALLFFGFIFVGKDFGAKTVFCSTLLSFVISGLELIVPMEAPLTNEPVLELIFAILLPAAGAAILFNIDASTGGTDIVAMIIKRFSTMNISSALFVADLAIVALSFYATGLTTGLFSLVGFIAKVFFVNNFLDSINLSKFCTVITSKEYEEQIASFVTSVLHKSATMSESFSSAYLHESKCVLFVALTRKQAVTLKRYVKGLDPKSFIIISNTSDISGNGFHASV